MIMRTIWFLGAVIVALAITWLSHDGHSPLYVPTSLDLLTLSAHDITDLLRNNTITSLQITKEYLRRIELDDRSGLGLRTILELTPIGSVLSIAKERDLERQKGLTRSPLHGVPLIVKGNMATDQSLGMSTSSGAFALQNATASQDAHIVAKARQAGMIILGKSNLAHPCGSSAGSVAAVAAGFAPLALGTETQGSISCPASFTALYGLKVSTGVLSRSGILPSSTTFDSPGNLAKSAWDIAALSTEIDGVDARDPITSEPEGLLVNFTNSLDASWADFRIGVADKEWFWSILPGFVGSQEDIDDEQRMFSAGLDVVREMERRGATIIADAKVTRWDQENSAQKYLESALDQKMTPEYQDALLEARKIAIEEGIIETLDSHNLDALVLPAWTDMSIYAAWAQAPTATVPLGKYRDGKPYGLGFVARRFDDGKLLQIMNLYEKTFPPRAVPERMRWKRWERFLPPDYLGAF
ncbi:amidase family protein [Penicillium sp. CMV-2018d]|nr:amidase family protein [Penicillium sp. CMV-2018d]